MFSNKIFSYFPTLGNIRFEKFSITFHSFLSEIITSFLSVIFEFSWTFYFIYFLKFWLLNKRILSYFKSLFSFIFRTFPAFIFQTMFTVFFRLKVLTENLIFRNFVLAWNLSFSVWIFIKPTFFSVFKLSFHHFYDSLHLRITSYLAKNRAESKLSSHLFPLAKLLF